MAESVDQPGVAAHMSWCSGQHDYAGGACVLGEEVLGDAEVAVVATPGDDAELWLGDVCMVGVAQVDIVIAKLAEYRERLAESLLEVCCDFDEAADDDSDGVS
jgi:hypothetical protein